VAIPTMHQNTGNGGGKPQTPCLLLCPTNFFDHQPPLVRFVCTRVGFVCTRVGFVCTRVHCDFRCILSASGPASRSTQVISREASIVLRYLAEVSSIQSLRHSSQLRRLLDRRKIDMLHSHQQTVTW
jgi:hypothetical protein